MSEGEDTDTTSITIDKLRASKAGHAYHEAWAARTALELLPPSSDLTAITLEGFSELDEQHLGSDAVEIADLVRYHGGNDVGRAHRVTIVQFKYSIASAGKPVRAADFASTLVKFAAADAELRAMHGEAHVLAVVRYEFASNRPIHENLQKAISAIIAGASEAGDTVRQAGQITDALAAYPHPFSELLSRLELVGSKGNLSEAERGISKVLAAWSEPDDPDAELRLLKLRNLIRIKAGPGSETDKQINRVAILAELGIEHEDRLYPTPDAFPEVEIVIQRETLGEITRHAREDGSPLIVHAAGGMGKTVLMQGLAEELRLDGPVVLFDGFGAGRWRDPADGRHLPSRTLVHLANLLAAQSLCDILLPVADVTGLIRAFRRRLEQAVESARQTCSTACVSLVLDAIDHAGIAAEDTATTSFAHLILQSISVSPIDGVRIIASCRTERLTLATGGAAHRPFPVPLFTDVEVRALVGRRVPDASAAEVAALLARSGRNPRCLDNLLTSGRPFDPVNFPDASGQPQDLLDALLRKRLDEARATARARGARDADIDLLLTGIALLAPPVPIEELAAAHGLLAEQVESFAADLAPLLERTPHGLMFRDEPTETLIRKDFGNLQAARASIIATLQERQLNSNYAARALPALLITLRDADQLIQLAYDDRVPRGASQVSGRDIRLARITAAIALTGEFNRRDDLLRLLLEASLVAAGHERSDRFLYDHPDLAAVAGDPEALRRLAAITAGWPGGRHSALALASAFGGDRDEARRHASRSIDWYNWGARKRRHSHFENQKVFGERDDIGFAYIKLIEGNGTGVAKFFSGKGEERAFAKFQEVFDLFDRHRHSAHPPGTRSLVRLLHSPLPSRALHAAALPFLTVESQAKRLVKAMAAAPAPDVADAKSEGLALASVLAAARAIDLGLESEASNILAGALLTPPNVYHYTSSFYIDRRIQVAVMAAGVKAALNCKRPGLVDIAPAEFIAMVPSSQRLRGAAAFGKALDRKLTGPKFDGKRRRRSHASLDEKRRSEYSHTLSSRILPLLNYAHDVTDIVRPPHGKTRREVVTTAFERLVHDVEQSSNYPYQDGKAYVARNGFRLLFEVADILGAIDTTLAKRMAEWAAHAPGLFTPELTHTVARLSRIPSCHDAALFLSSHVECMIQRDTDVGARVSAYGELARAVWRVDIEEAAVYFRRALDLAEAIGSDDFDRTSHLLELAGHYSGPELSPVAVHTLARILELNQHEDGKFPWIEYAQAMVPTAGRTTLAMLARQDDRDISRFSLSLGPALTILVHHSKLSADVAVALFGLAAPIEAWTWHISDFASEVLAYLPRERREWFFDTLLVEIDRNDQLSPSGKTIEQLHALAQCSLPADSRARLRIAGLLARRGTRSESRSDLPLQIATEFPAGFQVDITDPDAVDRHILAEELDETGRRWPVQRLSELAKQAGSPAKRLEFVRAVVEVTAATLSDKIYALDKYLDEWSKLSVALREALPTLGLRLGTRHAAELASSSVEAWGGWLGLEQHFHVDRSSLVEHVVAALRSSAHSLGGNAWLALAARLAPGTCSGAIAEGLERFLANSAQKLPAEVGDGPWSVSFSVPADEATFVAGLVWARLGHPDATMRWRAAHSVRRLTAIGRADVITKLIERFNSSASPFNDAKLPFYVMHAQLWLLIALARVAKDESFHLVIHRSFFENIAFSTEFPHVVMRAFAIDIVSALVPYLATYEKEILIAKLALTNQSPYPPAPRTGFGEYCYMDRPDNSPQPGNSFQLDYDFNKYQVERLCRVFGCPGWEVTDRINAWVRRWDKDVRGMHECPRSRGHEDDSSSEYVPGRDQYGSYLAWHALMLVAGDLLATRPVVGKEWDGDAWASFLKEYTLSRPDGLWLADLTDPFPLDLSRNEDLSMPKSGERSTAREDASLLTPMLGLKDGKVSTDWVPVAGRWSIGEDTTASIRSVLANTNDAQALVMALLSEEPFFRWLPSDEDEVARDCGGDDHTVQPWVAKQPNTDSQLDRHDPYAAMDALHRPFPSKWVQDLMGTAPDDPVVRHWSTKGQLNYRAEAWGTSGGRGKYAWSLAGHRLFIHSNKVLSLLKACGRNLVISIKFQKYHKGKSTGRPGDTSAFSHRSLVVVIDELGQVWSPRCLPRRATNALKLLATDQRLDFYTRFRVIAGLPDKRLSQRSARLAIDGLLESLLGSPALDEGDDDCMADRPIL